MTDLAPTREQTELAAAVRDLLARRGGTQGFDADLWATMCDQIGVAALAAEFSLAEAWVVLEQLGYSLVPSPLLASVTTAAALQAAGADDLLDRVASGTVATLVDGRLPGARSSRLATESRSPARSASDERVGDIVATRLPPVLWGGHAEIVLLATDDGLFSVDVDGISRTPLLGLDPGTSFARLDLSGARTTRLGALAPSVERVRALAVTALQVGVAQRGLDMTVEYSKQREQFGRPIGSFQALKHRMADMYVRVQMMRSGSWAATQAHVHGTDNADRLAAAATRYCADACLHVAGETVQIHGGIAITWEHDAHLVLKRAQVLRQL